MSTIDCEDVSQAPPDPWKAFAWFINQCAQGFGGELIKQGKTDTQARNTIVRCFLQMAAGEACRIARKEGRAPDPEKWRVATDDAFARAVKYTAQGMEAEGRDALAAPVEDRQPDGEADAP